jgi:hypothetical protein
MESYAIVKKTKEFNIPCIIIKSVSDIIPLKKPMFFPRTKLFFRFLNNFKQAKKGLEDFSNIFFKL